MRDWNSAARACVPASPRKRRSCSDETISVPIVQSLLYHATFAPCAEAGRHDRCGGQIAASEARRAGTPAPLATAISAKVLIDGPTHDQAIPEPGAGIDP